MPSTSSLPGQDWTAEEIEDLLTDAIGDSFDMDWIARDGAKAIMRELAECGLEIRLTEARRDLIENPPAVDRSELREIIAGEINVGERYSIADRILAAISRAEGRQVTAPLRPDGQPECHGLDTPERVCFYEQDFYVLSNFSSFTVYWSGQRFDTSEHLYHWLKFASGFGMFDGQRVAISEAIRTARSAHDAFKLAQEHKDMRRDDWDDVKITLMKRILHEKARQHAYVTRKLLATGDRELVENSWRDDFWGWGPNRDGQNMLGKLWMEVRADLLAAISRAEGRP